MLKSYKVSLKISLNYAYLKTCLCKFDRLSGDLDLAYIYLECIIVILPSNLGI